MRFPTLTVDMSLSDLHREVRYTLAVMRQRPWAAPRVPAFEGLLKEVATAEAESQGLLDKLEDATAWVDEADLHLDLFVDATAVDALQAVSKDTKAPLWRSLFGGLRPSQLTRPKLGDELEQVRTWPELLRAAPTEALRNRATPCAARVKAADDALRALQTAQTALQVFKTSKLTALVARLNSARSALAGESDQQLFDGKILPEASAGLFRLAPRSRPARRETVASVESSYTGQYLRQILAHDITFGIGPAGTGKTFLAVACAVDALERHGVQRIVLTRPAVEAGERLGFLPGDLAQKVDPYLRPLYDALYDLMGFDRVTKAFEKGALEIAPLAFMRGRTLNHAFVILDEAQNTTPEQMKMFLTRIGFGSKAVITGDATQIDVAGGRSGLHHMERILSGIDGLTFVRLTGRDVVRHRIVGDIVDAYERDAAANPGPVQP